MKKPSVLLVEDSEDDAFIFNWRFGKSGVTCVVQHVLEGAAAVEYLKTAAASDPDSLPVVIFLDLKMPVMNGFEVLSWLREQEALSRIPVIVLSGSDQQSDKDRALQLGATAYWVKPVVSADIQRYFKDICPARDENARAAPQQDTK
ncbi:MAG TPA: response regulator [Candidatus Limnocylindrales bacterium]|nr:response regulator [Candidatus Limnocylindrales bacterium]